LINDFRRLFFNLVLYIKTKLFPSIPESLGLAILLNIGGVVFSVALEVAWMLLEPEFDPRVIGMAIIGMLLSPSGTVLSV